MHTYSTNKDQSVTGEADTYVQYYIFRHCTLAYNPSLPQWNLRTEVDKCSLEGHQTKYVLLKTCIFQARIDQLSTCSRVGWLQWSNCIWRALGECGWKFHIQQNLRTQTVAKHSNRNIAVALVSSKGTIKHRWMNSLSRKCYTQCVCCNKAAFVPPASNFGY